MKAFLDRLYCFYNFENDRPRSWSSQFSNQGRKAVIGAICEQDSIEDMGFTLEAMKKPLVALGYEIIGELSVFKIFDKAKVKDDKNSKGIVMEILRTNSSNTDFKELCFRLDCDLNDRYGKVQSTYDKHNIIEDNQTVIVGYLNKTPIAAGCFKAIDEYSIEIKRMYVNPAHRRNGFSTKVLSALEAWAKELGYSFVRLETGKGQAEAIGLYKKAGYEVTENYGPYIGIENSICMKKKI